MLHHCRIPFDHKFVLLKFVAKLQKNVDMCIMMR